MFPWGGDWLILHHLSTENSSQLVYYEPLWGKGYGPIPMKSLEESWRRMSIVSVSAVSSLIR